MATLGDIGGTRPTVTVEPPTPVTSSVNARQDTFHRLAQIMLGRQLQAEVLSRFDDGTFLVKVADTPARMALPDSTKVGDRLSMTMLAHEPRPTLLLNTEPGSAKATLSSTGRLIDTILQLAQRGGAETAVTAKDALLPSAAVLANGGATPQVADALHDAMTFSGLFYEAHLHEWINGSRTQADLMREPQAQHAGGTPQPASASAQTLATTQSSLEARLAELLNTALPLAANPAVTDADTLLPPAGKSDVAAMESLQLVPLQLHALEQRQVAWRGELFPGQPMEWSINEDTPRRDAEGREQQQWQSAVRFELPALGSVSATILLSGDRLQIQVRSTSDATVATLRNHGPELANALEAAGSRVDSLLIKQDEQA
jgi:hypothetical protein